MTEKPKNVRLATLQDSQKLLDSLAHGKDSLHFENGAFSVAPDKVIKIIAQATTNQGGIIGIIDGENGEIAGSIGLFLDSFWYSNDYCIFEYWNFVTPNYRRTSAAPDLIDFAKWVSEQMNLVLNIGILSTHRTEAKQRLYSRKLTAAGAFLFHNLEFAKGPAFVKISSGST